MFQDIVTKREEAPNYSLCCHSFIITLYVILVILYVVEFTILLRGRMCI